MPKMKQKQLPISIDDGISSITISPNISIPWGIMSDNSAAEMACAFDKHAKCNICKEYKEEAIEYSGPKIKRSICKDCYCKKMDKFFGIKDEDAEMEQILFEKKSS